MGKVFGLAICALFLVTLILCCPLKASAHPAIKKSPSIPACPAQINFKRYLSAVDKYWGAPLGQIRPEELHRINSAYIRYISICQMKETLESLPADDLKLLFRAAYIASTLTRGGGTQYSHDAMRDLTVMEQRKLIDRSYQPYRKMYRILVLTRQFSAARKFSQKHTNNGLTIFPKYADKAKNVAPGAPTALFVSTTKRELVRRPVKLKKSGEVIILVDPQCHFCAYFFNAIPDRPKLRATLERNAIWLVPLVSANEFDTLQAWNRQHPEMPLHIIYDLKQWPMIHVLGVPRFYFMQSGKLRDKHIGWSKKGDFSALIQGLQAIGLWPPKHSNG